MAGVVALLMALGACGRASRDDAALPPPADTLGNGVPRSLVPRLADWVARWRLAHPGFEPESLERAGVRPVAFDYAWAGAGAPDDGIRARAGIEVLSPDSSRALDWDMYLVIDGEEPSREVDSAPVLADFRSDTLWRVEFCGTPCFHDGAVWVDARRFALTGATRSGVQADGPWRPTLALYDLAGSRVTRWVGPVVEDAAFERYLAASHAALVPRIRAARAAGASDSTALSRVHRAAVAASP